MKETTTKMEYEKAMEYIFTMIERGELTVGSRLPTEREIAATLDIGRNSTREALSILHGMGMVERIQGSGNYISGNANDTIRHILVMLLALGRITKKDVCEFRRTMEKAACMILLEKGITEEYQTAFEKILKDMKKESGKKQAQLDKQFHELLMEASGNTLLVTIMSAVMTVYREWIDIVLKRADDEAKEHLQKYHEGIYDGIADGKTHDVYDYVDRHYDLIEKLIGL